MFSTQMEKAMMNNYRESIDYILQATNLPKNMDSRYRIANYLARSLAKTKTTNPNKSIIYQMADVITTLNPISHKEIITALSNYKASTIRSCLLNPKIQWNIPFTYKIREYKTRKIEIPKKVEINVPIKAEMTIKMEELDKQNIEFIIKTINENSEKITLLADLLKRHDHRDGKVVVIDSIENIFNK